MENLDPITSSSSSFYLLNNLRRPKLGILDLHCSSRKCIEMKWIGILPLLGICRVMHPHVYCVACHRAAHNISCITLNKHIDWSKNLPVFSMSYSVIALSAGAARRLARWWPYSSVKRMMLLLRPMRTSMSLTVCLSVCPRAYLRNHT